MTLHIVELPPGAKRRPVTTVAAKIFRSILQKTPSRIGSSESRLSLVALCGACFYANSQLQPELHYMYIAYMHVPR